MMRSVHDNTVYAYTVDCRQKCIILQTEYGDGTPRELSDIVFDGVIAHRFDNQLAGNILFDVKETELAALIRAEADLFDHARRYGWPEVEASTNDEQLAALLGGGTKAYGISASYGLSGWVMAESMTIVAHSQILCLGGDPG